MAKILQRPPLHPSSKDKLTSKRIKKNKSPPTTNDDDDLNNSDGTISENSSADKSTLNTGKGLYPILDDELQEISKNSESPISNRDTSTSNTEACASKILGTKERQEKTSRNKFFILAGLIAFLAICYLFLGLKNEHKPSNAAKVIGKLRKDFVNQPQLSMRSVKKSLKVIDSGDEPESPGIILFVSSKGAQETTDCLSDQLAKLVKPENGVIAAVDARNLQKRNPEEIKKDIDDQIQNHVFQDRLNVFLIKHIDRIPGEAALIMQKYCDHENSPYKRAMIIMTISTHEEISKDVNSKIMNGIARGHLNQTWVDLKLDQFDPLFTRISGYISVVQREPQLPNCKS